MDILINAYGKEDYSGHHLVYRCTFQPYIPSEHLLRIIINFYIETKPCYLFNYIIFTYVRDKYNIILYLILFNNYLILVYHQNVINN